MNISFSCVESRVENNKNIYGRFILAPFLPGHAVTLANGLRRCLLSEVYGVAITAIEINGITHEYSTITGIRESVLDILLNVREIVLTSELQFQRPQIAFLQVQGPGTVRASDIKLPISIQNVKPEQHIATLLYDGVLNMKFMICCGKNFFVQTPRGLKTPKILKQTLTQKNNEFKTTIKTKKIQIAYMKYSTYLKKQKDLDQDFVNRPDSSEEKAYYNVAKIYDPIPKYMKPAIFYQKVGKTMSEFVLTSLSLKKKRSFHKRLIINNKIKKHIKRKKRIRYLDSLTLLKNKNISTYRDYLLRFCKKKKKDFVFTEYLLRLREKKWKSYLPIDAVFAPVSRVNFAIENNDLSNAPKERINLEIWTNGSIHPIQAIIEAAKAFTDITLFLKNIRNNKSLFINSPNKLINVLLFKKSLKRLVKQNKKIQKHYLTIKTQNEQRVEGMVTSEDGSPDMSQIDSSSYKTSVRGIISQSEDMKHKLTSFGKKKYSYNELRTEFIKFKTGEPKRKGKSKKKPTGKRKSKKKVQLYVWRKRVPSIYEYVDNFPHTKVSANLARHLTIKCDQRIKALIQLNSTVDIGDLNLSLRPYNCLKQAKIETLGDLLQKSAEDLLHLKNFGKQSLNEVENILNQYHLKLSSQKIDKSQK